MVLVSVVGLSEPRLNLGHVNLKVHHMFLLVLCPVLLLWRLFVCGSSSMKSEKKMNTVR